MDIFQIISALEGELGDRKGFFGKKVDLERCAALVDALRVALPQTIAEAEYISKNQAKILENADNVAKNTIKEAEKRALYIAQNSEIMAKAEDESRRVVEAAYRQCDILVRRTKEHLDKTFKEVEHFLLSTVAMVKNNRDELKNALTSK